MGITSTLLPQNPYNYLEQGPPELAPVPEIDNTSLEAVVFYVTCLQTPLQRNAADSTVQYGNRLFVQIGCAACHRPTLTTGYSPIAALSNQRFQPFTDLLVHDMGSGLDDGYTEGTAKTSEWRTTPLWGLGLAPGVQGGSYYLMHDGRAHSMEQAIGLHGGEASVSAGRFQALSEGDKSALLSFLKSL